MAEFTPVEIDVVWEHLGLGPTPVVLRLPSPGRTARERLTVTADAWRALRERGLAGPHGADPELVRLLRLLAQPGPRLELRGGWDHVVRAVAVDSGVLAVSRGESVTVAPCGSLPSTVLGLLPSVGPGSGFACTVPTSVLAGALSAPVVRSALIARDVPAADAGVLARMLDGVGGRAQITAGGRRPEDVVTVLDGPSGRCMLTRLVGPDGVEWTTVAPADARTLRHRVAGLVTTTDLWTGAVI